MTWYLHILQTPVYFLLAIKSIARHNPTMFRFNISFMLLDVEGFSFMADSLPVR